MKKHSRTTTKAKAKSRTGKRGPRAGGEQIREQMLGILLRGRGETLGEACARMGVSVQTYYHRLRKASFGAGRGGKRRKVGISSVDAQRLKMLVNRQQRLQVALADLQRKILSG